MEVEEEITQNENIEKKHKFEDEENPNKENKKIKAFSAKDFRKQLSQGDKISSITNFLNCVKENKKHDYIFEYLESGGNCLELLQQLELESSLNPCIVFELVTYILLQINAKYPQYQNSATEACRYILNTYVTLVNKMINLSSSTFERRTVLKLLTAIATMSLNLAQEVLIKVNFNQTNLELLTKHTGQKDSVRDVFIHFLTGFLVDGHYPNLILLLRKRGLLTSIVRDLQYDNCETVCLVITAMKSHILENPSVSKTSKMKTFSTQVVRDIVNLYNWKGPASFKAQKKNSTQKVEVNEFEKSKVSQCVHEFLLILCTSHKYGIVFRDHSMGLGQKHQNSLMYTVLESLDRPWEHSYAGELVTRICGACPDLSKTMWANLKPYLELRATKKWLNAMNFGKTLLSELKPSCIDFCAQKLSVHQLTQVISFLIMPLPILKTIIPDNFIFESQIIKQNVVSLLLDFLKYTEDYIKYSTRWLKSADDHKKLKLFLSNYISRNFPDAFAILNNWKVVEQSDEIIGMNSTEYLNVIFDIFHVYKNLAPQLLEPLNTKEFNFKEFILSLDELEADVEALQIKCLNLFVDFDNSQFSTKSELFSFVVPLLLKFYYNNSNLEALNVLNKLFKLTNIFDGCEYEVNFWINGILDLKKFDETVANVIVEVLKQTNDNLSYYLNILNGLRGEEESVSNFNEIIENLSQENITSYENNCIKNIHLSPFVIGFFEYLQNIDVTKYLKVYLQFVLVNLFHSQTIQNSLKNIFSKYSCIPSNVTQYVEGCLSGEQSIIFPKQKGKIDVFGNFSEEFLSGQIDTFLKNHDDFKMYPDLILNLLQLSTFYINNLTLSHSLSENHVQNFETFLNFIVNSKNFDESYLLIILGNPNLYRKFSISHLNKNLCSKFLISSIKLLKKADVNIEKYLRLYRKKLVRILKKPHKCQGENFKDILTTFNLDFEQCRDVLSKIFSDDNFNTSLVVTEITSYCLERIIFLYENNEVVAPLDESLIGNLSLYFIYLTKEQIDVSKLSVSIKSYLQTFPFSLKYLNSELFESLLNLSEYNKDNVSLCVFLLNRDAKYLLTVRKNIDVVCEKKYIILPLLQNIADIDDDLLNEIYNKFESSLNKVLLKPQKAGQHFLNNHHGLYSLFKKCMTLEKCRKYFEKIQKYEVSEVFLSTIIQAISEKLLSDSVTEKQVNNIILTYIHLLMNLFKRKTKNDEDLDKVTKIAESFNSVLEKFVTLKLDFNFKSAGQNETFKLFCKFCLKFGISGNKTLLSILTSLIQTLNKSIDNNDARTLFELMISHSEFLDVALGENTDCKTGLLGLFLVMCTYWNELMERSHIPVLLSSYKATTNKCDKIILTLLQMYETHAEQTQFYDFKPFLWDRAAATHYSVRSSMENKLARQPRMGDVLDLLQDQLLQNTIKFYPINDKLQKNMDHSLDIIKTVESSENPVDCYDLSFLLPLFSQLLAPENQVQTYRFTRSGALSVTVVALSSQDEDMRKAACHVLARFHAHVEARQSGKDNLLWIRFIDAVCKGTALLEGFQINNFAAIFLARMALILTQPNHVMYVPMSQYLTAKPSLDFSTVPELHTYLHSCDINYVDHRRFVLELLRDGLRTEKDFTDFLRSMAFKLFSTFYSSSLSNVETKLLMLDIVISACKIPLANKVLCENHSLLPQINFMLDYDSHLEGDHKKDFMTKFIRILSLICGTVTEKHSNTLILNMLFKILPQASENKCKLFDTLLEIFNRYPEFFENNHFDKLLSVTDDKLFKYISQYGCDFVTKSDLSENSDQLVSLRLLLFMKYKVC